MTDSEKHEQDECPECKQQAFDNNFRSLLESLEKGGAAHEDYEDPFSLAKEYKERTHK